MLRTAPPRFRDPDVASARASARRRIARLLVDASELPSPLPDHGLSLLACDASGADALLEVGAKGAVAKLRVRAVSVGGLVTSLRRRRPGQVVTVAVESRGPEGPTLEALARAVEARVDAASWAEVERLLAELRGIPSDRELDVYRHVIAGIDHPMAMIRTGLRCNQDCGFCWQSREWIDFAPAQILTWIDDLRAAGIDDLVISGGEPTLDRSLEAYVRHAKDIGFSRVSIESNAIHFAKPGNAERLRAAGLDCALISLHSPDPEVSDAETRAPGTHARTVAGIRRLLDVGIEVILNALMTPRTLRTLPAFPAFVAQAFGGAPALRQVLFSIPCDPFDRALAPEVIPDPRAVRAVLPGVIEEALRLGLPVKGLETPCGPPLCAFDADPRVAKLAEVAGPIDFRAHVPACEPCSVRPFCFGVRRAQIDLYGDDWVTPIRAASSPASLAAAADGDGLGPEATRAPPRRETDDRTRSVGAPSPGGGRAPSVEAPSPADGRGDEVVERNVAVVREALAPLLEPIVQSVLTIGAFEGDPAEPAVSFELASGDEVLRVRVASHEPGRAAFLRTPSFDIAYHSDRNDGHHRPPSPPMRRALGLLRRALELTDGGGYRLEPPPRRAQKPQPQPQPSGEPREDVLGHTWNQGRFDQVIERAIASSDKQWVIAIVKQPCEQHCVFCPSSDRDKTSAEWGAIPARTQLEGIVHQLRRARVLGARNAAMGGNECLRFPFIFELLDEAVSLGFERIFLQTTGLPLEDRAVAERLARFPPLELLVPIYGTTAEEHEAITRTAGTFERLCRGLDHAVALGAPRFRLQTLALGSTFARIDALADFVRQRFASSLYVAPLRANRIGERVHLGDFARLADVRALARRRPELKMTEFPLCVLGPEQRTRRAKDGIGRDTDMVNMWELGLEKAEDPAIVRDRLYGFVGACERCAVRGECPGVLQPYLDRHGGAEVEPLPG